MYHHLMSFHWDTHIGEFLFPGLTINGPASVAIACLVLVLISLTYEGIKVIQTQSKARAARERLRPASCQGSETITLITSNLHGSQNANEISKKVIQFLGHLMLFLCNNILGYFLMLAVMVYNYYVFIAIVLGMGLGYFLFGHKAVKINIENIRARTNHALFANKSAAASSSGMGQTNTIKYSSNSSSDSSESSSTINPYMSAPNASFSANAVSHNEADECNTIDSCRL